MKKQAFAIFNPPQRSAGTRGGVLVIILVAVALFAALSFAMTQGMRSGSGQLTEQQAKLAASDIIDYLTKVKSTFDQLVINGCDPLLINFRTTVYQNNNGFQPDSTPPGSPPNCYMYGIEGGTMTPVIFPKYASTNYTPTGSNVKGGHAYTRYVNAQNKDGTYIGTSAHDLFFQFVGMDEKICLAVLNAVATSGTIYDTIPIIPSHNVSVNAYTPGAAGSLTPLYYQENARIGTRRYTGWDYCAIGILLKVN